MGTRELQTDEDIATAKYDIEIWLLAIETLELCQDGLASTWLTKQNFAFSVEFGKLIFAYWTEDRAESWRVRACRLDASILELDVTTPFQTTVRRLLLYKQQDQNIVGEIPARRKAARQRFLERLRTIVTTQLAIAIAHASIGRSDRHGYGAAFARLVLRDRQSIIAAIGVSVREDADTIAALLGQGLNWLAALRARFAPTAVNRLFLFAPLGRAELLAQRLTLLARTPDQIIELFEVDEANKTLMAVRPYDQGDLGLQLARSTRLPTLPGKIVLPPPLAVQADWIRSIAPDRIEIRPIISNQWKVELYGLELARIYADRNPRVEFGIEDQQILTAANQSQLAELILAAVHYRRADSPAKQHILYRAAPEAWLESILRYDIQAFDINLRPDYLYSQVPVIRQRNRRYVDLLAVGRDGQLVIIELKVTEAPELPFQGLDYWLRVEWHRQRGDFLRQGYFATLTLKNAPAYVYLVAPQLRFHESFNTIAAAIDSRAAIFRIAINDNWREGLKVQSRERIN
ncbi:MAG: hypothetical protein AB1489_31055 [Acidobacteriota bacterium]